jgi:hypothetical protein
MLLRRFKRFTPLMPRFVASRSHSQLLGSKVQSSQHELEPKPNLTKPPEPNMNSVQFARFAALLVTAVLASAAFSSASAADVRVAEPMLITAKRIAPALQVRVAEPMMVVAKREAANVQVAAKATARRAG